VVRPRWRKVFRDLWLHRSRTVLVIAAIAIGQAGAGAVLNTWALVERATREEYRASIPPSATLRVDSVDGALLDRVKSLPGIRDAQARRTTFAAAFAPAGRVSAILFTVDDFTAIRIGKVEPESGGWPPADGELVIERSSLAFSGASVGESLRVAVGTGESVPLAVTGVARDVGLAPGWMEHVLYGFVSRGTLTKLGVSPALDQLVIAVDGGLDRDAVRRLAYQVKEAVAAAGNRVSNVEVPVPGQHVHAGQMNSLLYTQGAFGLLALLLSGFLVVNLISAMLVGQVREIGMMKAIGGRSGQIAGMYLGLAAILGLAAAAVALPVAAAVGRRYAGLKAELLNFDIAGYEIPGGVLAVQLAACVLLPVLAALIPVVRGCRVSVGAALRDFGIVGNGASTGWLLERGAGINRPLLLSLRNAFRRRQRLALTLLALTTGGAVYLGAENLRVAIKASVDLLFAPHRYDFTVRFQVGHRPDLIEAAVGRVAGVGRAEAWGSARAAVTRPDGTLGNAFPIAAPPAPTRLLAHRLEAGRWIEPGDGNTLVVNRGLHGDEPQLTVGAKVTLLIAGRTSDWTVVGVVESGPGPTAYAARETIAALAGDERVATAAIAVSAGGAASQLELIQRLRDELGRDGLAVQSSQLLIENRRVIEDHLLMVADFLGIMAWLIIAVGGLGLASTMSLAVLERTREIGVMKAIGARHRSILTMVQVEGLVIAILSWAIAIPLSLPMSVGLGQAFGRIMIRVPVMLTPAPGPLAVWLALAVVVSLVACTWPALRATRVTTATALSYT
jgi:putative ABC transport system permease protein